jgi:excisionase family DNA binding protein
MPDRNSLTFCAPQAPARSNSLDEIGIRIQRELDLVSAETEQWQREAIAEAKRLRKLAAKRIAREVAPLVAKRTAREATPPADGLCTMREAAARLGCSVRTLQGHIASGAIRYVNIGHGRTKPRRMFTDSDLAEFIANQTRKDSPCQSIATRAHHTSNTTSKSQVIAFSARPSARLGGTRKR